ncbi:pentapeptide repeat-containing protein [Frankia gtarii]|uniref:pentapeptide repeat-containing protein n=1 Tax=Frankia gtarii TaxID=2950102 RepID=UPI0021BFD905|nr:pentapeptide repeat-containing protein [Frankia gtarii]
MADSRGSARRSGRRWLWAVAALAGLGAVAAVVGIWHLPDRMYPAAGDAEARAALQGGLLTAAAALVAVAGALIALDETRQANTETRRANEAADAREREANKNTHVRELFTRAVDQLGSDNGTVRLGGIYALERIATDSPPDQRTVMEVLSAFIRMRSTDPALRPPTPADGEPLPPSVRPAADIRAAVQVLARLPRQDGVPRSDLTGAGLTGPSSLDNLDLTDATLTGAVLVGANLTGAVLVGANLAGARMPRANLAGARMRGANLAGTVLVRANLTEAVLVQANLTEAVLVQANLTRAVVSGANLAGAWLTQEQADAARGDDQTRLPAGIVRPASWTRP